MGGMSKWRRENRSSTQARDHAKPQSGPPMRMAIELITPEMARAWLAANQSNRPISEQVIKRYAEDMKAGRWKATHQGIAFDRAGLLLDGQHRLRAIIRAGIAVLFAVFRDCDRDTFDRLDTGRKRTAADALAIDGTEHARTLAAIARSLIRFGFKESGVTDAFVVEFAREHGDELAEFVPLAGSLTASGAAAFAFASTDSKLKDAAARLLNDPSGRELEDLGRCIRVLAANTGTTGQRARYQLVMNAIRAKETR